MRKPQQTFWPLQYLNLLSITASLTSLVAQLVKNLPAVRET